LAAIHLPRKKLGRKTRDTPFDIEIMTPQGSEKVLGCCCVRWCGKKPFCCKYKHSKLRDVNFQTSDFEMLKKPGGLKHCRLVQYVVSQQHVSRELENKVVPLDIKAG